MAHARRPTRNSPWLRRSRRFVGSLTLKRKCRVLASAWCLLAPSLVPETSSLVAMKAAACGTPVIAFPSGALSEIVEHECRAEAERRFSQQMCRRYLDLYANLVVGRVQLAGASL